MYSWGAINKSRNMIYEKDGVKYIVKSCDFTQNSCELCEFHNKNDVKIGGENQCYASCRSAAFKYNLSSLTTYFIKK